MKPQEIQKYIDRVVGTEGTLRTPSWWMHKILSDLVKYCEENEGASDIKNYIESQFKIVGETIDGLDARLETVESHELFEIVSELPSKPKHNTVYLVPSINGEGNNALTEWVHIDDIWEQFGELKADINLNDVYKELSKKLESEIVDTTTSTEEIIFGYDDTEIWAELTELSAEVSGLSERIDNLPSAESDVFKAVYGETTYEEVVAAYESGKVVHCDYQERCYTLAMVVGGAAWFSSVAITTCYMIHVTSDGWGKGNYTMEYVSGRRTVINAQSTDDSYPSCKAVYDFVNNTLGTIINGDY